MKDEAVSMRERLARAMSEGRLRRDPNFNWSEEDVAQLSASNWSSYIPDVDAVLEAMMEPTEEMVKSAAELVRSATYAAHMDAEVSDDDLHIAEAVFIAMITSARNGGKER